MEVLRRTGRSLRTSRSSRCLSGVPRCRDELHAAASLNVSSARRLRRRALHSTRCVCLCARARILMCLRTYMLCGCVPIRVCKHVHVCPSIHLPRYIAINIATSLPSYTYVHMYCTYRHRWACTSERDREHAEKQGLNQLARSVELHAVGLAELGHPHAMRHTMCVRCAAARDPVMRECDHL